VNPDQQAIVDLTIAYAWALDCGRYDEVRDVFTPDAVVVIDGGEQAGVDAVIAQADAVLTRLDASQHVVTNHAVHVDGDAGTCRSYFQAHHVLGATHGGDTFLLAGRWDDIVTRRPEGWRIRHRTITSVWRSGNVRVMGRP
jgi:ketosteroid isomerase-like protein